jgi:hypothetical protein
MIEWDAVCWSKADIEVRLRNVRFVPKADIMQRSKNSPDLARDQNNQAPRNLM